MLYILQFAHSIIVSVKAVSHNEMHADEVGEGLETANRQVTLEIDPTSMLVFRFDVCMFSTDRVIQTNLVLDRLIAPNGGHILRHFAGFNGR